MSEEQEQQMRDAATAAANALNEFNPNADEAYIAAHKEEVQAFVEDILTSVKTFLRKIG